ncbi:helix-turn-helix domain-containing protein [Pikeienuella piscinae]|uniref:Helix-turn-helix domain-containing protein n=1 Tax=Pikeienuella piscinae TaxID=2748098 RepID=A0A7L5BY33_9RHOB|nr:helix-turn-helix domain-containing protein [Pikeienuella piscinae]QIE56652.1 helix-turn-helix domain-containing protein [Pikeienuella piscinae]
MKPETITRLMTRDEVAETYGISKRHLELAPSRREGPAFLRIGRSVRYRPTDVEAWLEARVVRPGMERDR